jgi:hypothetical protein
MKHNINSRVHSGKKKLNYLKLLAGSRARVKRKKINTIEKVLKAFSTLNRGNCDKFNFFFPPSLSISLSLSLSLSCAIEEREGILMLLKSFNIITCFAKLVGKVLFSF